MYRVILANKYKEGKKFKVFELYHWAETKKELDNKKKELKKLFFLEMRNKKIPFDKLNFGIIEIIEDKNFLNTTKIKSKTFLIGD